jgi:hypothetical protein
MKPATHFKLLPRLRMHRILVSLHLCAFLAWCLGTKKSFTKYMDTYIERERIFLALLVGSWILELNMDKHILDHDFPCVGDKINLFHHNLFPTHLSKKTQEKVTQKRFN